MSRAVEVHEIDVSGMGSTYAVVSCHGQPVRVRISDHHKPLGWHDPSVSELESRLRETFGPMPTLRIVEPGRCQPRTEEAVRRRVASRIASADDLRLLLAYATDYGPAELDDDYPTVRSLLEEEAPEILRDLEGVAS